MRDVRPLYSVGLPIASLAVCVVVACASPALYRSYVRRHEVGLLEQGTVICLAPAVAWGVISWMRRRALPARWLGVWIAVLTAGALYYAGEECSWGQNYFGWATPHGWARINDQNETNLHNTSSLFDHAPRGLLSLAAGFCVVAPLALRRWQTNWNPTTEPWGWVLPTRAVVAAAALALLVGVPQKLYGHYDKTREAGNWFHEMLLAGRHSELKEYFLAVFILMYLWSFGARLRSLERSSSHSQTTPERADTHADRTDEIGRSRAA